MNNPRLWSLLDIMNAFRGSAMAGLAAQAQLILSGAQAGISIMDFGKNPPSAQDMRMAINLIVNLKGLCLETGLNETAQQISLIEYHFGQNASRLTLLTFHAHLTRVMETLMAEMNKRKFLFISADRTELFENENSFGPMVLKKFPLAKNDIVAAGNCLCAECYTASVFHLMRAFEWALRTLCVELGMGRMKEFEGRTQRFKYTPHSFATWDRILGQLGKKADKRINLLRPGVKRQNLQEYYNTVLEDVKFAKDAWRNHVMHTRRTFERGEAHDLFLRVKNMMQRMANDKAI